MMTLDSVISTLGEKFIDITGVATTLYNSHTLCEQGVVAHSILYGPAGHAKTQIARGFLNMMYEGPIFDKIAMGTGTTIYDILGFSVPDEIMKGRKVFQYDYGFMAANAALFDEFLDAPASVLEQLKAVIMDAEHCVNGVVCYKSRCKFIIACTNHELNEWVINPLTNKPDNSRKAVLERFPFSYRVFWEKYDAETYSRMFEVVLKDPSESFARMMELSAQKNKVISPRTAILAARSYKQHGLSGLVGIEDLDPTLLEDFEKLVAAEQEIKKVLDVQKEFDIFASYMRSLSRGVDSAKITKAVQIHGTIQKTVNQLKPPASHVQTVALMRQDLEEYKGKLAEYALQVIKNANV